MDGVIGNAGGIGGKARHIHASQIAGLAAQFGGVRRAGGETRALGGDLADLLGGAQVEPRIGEGHAGQADGVGQIGAGGGEVAVGGPQAQLALVTPFEGLVDAQHAVHGAVPVAAAAVAGRVDAGHGGAEGGVGARAGHVDAGPGTGHRRPRLEDCRVGFEEQGVGRGEIQRGARIDGLRQAGER